MRRIYLLLLAVCAVAWMGCETISGLEDITTQSGGPDASKEGGDDSGGADSSSTDDGPADAATNADVDAAAD